MGKQQIDEAAASTAAETGCTKDQCCGPREVELAGTLGFTGTFGTGESSGTMAGFCTPDTNAFQVTIQGSYKFILDEAKTKTECEKNPTKPCLCLRKSFCSGGKAACLRAAFPKIVTVTGVLPIPAI